MPPGGAVVTAARQPGRARVGWRVGVGAVGVPVAGTGLALLGDHLLGGLDGRPALHLLIVLALPFWDALPARLGPRVLSMAGLVAATATVWLVLGSLRPEPWWRAEVSFGLACLLVAAIPVAVGALAGPGRTVDR